MLFYIEQDTYDSYELVLDLKIILWLIKPNYLQQRIWKSITK